MKSFIAFLCALTLGASAFGQSSGWTVRDQQLVRRFINDHETLGMKGAHMALAAGGVTFMGDLIRRNTSHAAFHNVGILISFLGLMGIADAALFTISRGHWTFFTPFIERSFGIPTAQADDYKASALGFRDLLARPDDEVAFQLDRDPELAELLTLTAQALRAHGVQDPL